MKKYTSNILIALILLGVALAPSLSFAQTDAPAPAPIVPSGSISQAELRAMKEAEDKVSFASANMGYTDVTFNAGALMQEFNNARDSAMSLCKALGDKIYSITAQQQSSVWVEPSYRCSTALVIPNKTPTDILGKQFSRSYSVTAEETNLYNKLVGMRTSQKAEPDLTADAYTKIKGQAEQTAQKEDVNKLFQFLSWIISIVSNIWASVFAGAAMLAVKLLNETLKVVSNYQTATPQIVERGWMIIRDFMNMFFILSLIIMALATILRIESYNYKSLLRQLIIMALLINFSKAIADVLIAVSNSLMLTLNPSEGAWAIGKTVYNSYVLQGNGFAGFVGDGQGFVESTGSAVTKLIGLAIFTVSLTAIALLLFVRLIGLWFLVMVSPVAYALNILPRTKSYAQMWWTNFTKYLIWGPVAIFFYKIAYTLINENSNNFFSDSFLNHLFISAFLWAGFLVAKGSGMMFSNAIITGANKGLNYAKSGTRAYGNLWWRGTAPGAVAGLAGAGVAGVTAGRYGGYKDWSEKTKNAVGKSTAWIENQPKLAKTKLIDNPNKERSKLVDKGYRRGLIRRDYLKDFDEEFAKKLSAEEVDYALDQPKLFNESKFNNIIDHGNDSAKMALLLSWQEGKLQKMFDSDTNKWDKATQDKMKQRLREFAWKKRGRKLSDLEKEENKTFLSEQVVMVNNVPQKEADGTTDLTYLKRDLALVPKSKKFDTAKTIPEKMKNSYQEIDKPGYYNPKDKKKKKEEEVQDDKPKKPKNTIGFGQNRNNQNQNPPPPQNPATPPPSNTTNPPTP